MRLKTMFSFAVLVCAVAAVFASTASAALPEFAVSPNKLEAKSGAGVLEGALTIKCTSDKIKKEAGNEVKTAKTATAKVIFEGCKVGIFAANSVGDAANTILAEIEGELCYIVGSTKAAPKVGLYSKLLKNVVIESAGVKSEVTGAVIGEVKPLNKKQLTGEINYVKPNFTECFPENENKGAAKKHTLEAKTGKGAFAPAEEETKEEVTFEKEEEVKA